MERRLYHLESTCPAESRDYAHDVCECGWLQDLALNGWPADQSRHSPAVPQPEAGHRSLLCGEQLDQFLVLLSERCRATSPAR